MFSKYPMIPVEGAKSLILSSLPKILSETVPISSCLNRVLSEDIYSPIDFPPFRASTMDGYAVRSSETPNMFSIFSSIRAGDSLSSSLPPSHCSYITTGAAVPPEADAVIPIEEVKILSNQIEIPKCQSNQFIRQVGSDISKGELVGEKDSILRASHIALLASIGINEVQVKKTPVVGLLSTGSELKEVGQVCKYGEIVDSNRLMIKLMLQELGVSIKDYGIVSDEFENIRETIRKMSLECDLWISSGGVSMGDKDYVKPIIEMDGEVVFGRINMKPGKPMTFGKIGNCLAFALPGNPVSCFVCYYLFVRMAIDEMLTKPQLPIIKVKLNQRLKLDFRPEYHRSTVQWDKDHFIAVSTGNQQSSRLQSTVNSNCILIFPMKTETQTEIFGEVEGILLSSFSNVPPPPATILSDSTHSSQLSSIARVTIITVSDRVHSKTYEDKTGPYLQTRVKELWHCEVDYKVVPDEYSDIKSSILSSCESSDLIITTGGTGFGPRDRTPEVTQEIIEKPAQGLITKMLIDGLKSTEFACLSRQLAGTRGKSLIVNFPGSPGGVRDCFESIYKLVPHIVFLIKQ